MPISTAEALLQDGWRVESQAENPPVVGVSLESGETQDARPSTPQTGWNWSDGIGLDVAHATRIWIQYGMLGFAVLCIVIGAIKGVLGI